MADKFALFYRKLLIQFVTIALELKPSNWRIDDPVRLSISSAENRKMALYQ